MSYTCHNHEKRAPVTSQMQDGWTEDGRRAMTDNTTKWADVQCGHITSSTDPACTGCRWRGE
jgi:hypothetical protein